MTLDRNTFLSKLLKDSRAVEIIEKYSPGFVDSDIAKTKKSNSLNQISRFQGGDKGGWLTFEMVDRIEEDLKKL